jgi:hypothetical protein
MLTGETTVITTAIIIIISVFAGYDVYVRASPTTRSRSPTPRVA